MATSLPFEIWDRIMLNLDTNDIQQVIRVSKLHLIISSKISFRARYFLYNCQRWLRIFEASRYPEIFTLGMTIETLVISFTENRKSFTIYSAIMQHGFAQYSKAPSAIDWQVLKYELGYGRAPYEISLDALEIFKEGRFAPHDRRDAFQHALIHRAMARHPELIPIIENNGFQVNEMVLNKVVQHLLEDSYWTEVELYSRIDNLVKLYPDLLISATSCERFLSLDTAGFSYAAGIPTTLYEYEIWSQNDNLGPMPAAFKVIKKLFDEGKVFQDLEERLMGYLNETTQWSEQSLPMIRILYRLFPDILWCYHDRIHAAYTEALIELKELMNDEEGDQESTSNCP